MSKRNLNFALGSRGLTAEETASVENAKNLLISSFTRHRKDIAIQVVFATVPKAKAAAKPAAKKAAAKPAAKKAAAKPRAKAFASGSATWTSDRIAPAIRKY
jgi:hypothetical protein